MITDSAQLSAARIDRTDRDASYREEFLTLLARLRLEPALAIALVETVTGHPFDMCSAAELVPLLQQLLDLLHSHCSPVEARPQCHV